MSEKLLPCPFCGGNKISVWDKSRYDVCVRCDKCDAQTDWLPTISDAITAWNNRTQPNEPLTLEQLKRMDGEPMWTVTNGVEGSGRWEIVDSVNDKYIRLCNPADESYDCESDTYGKTWLAYRNKVDEGVE